MTTTTNMDWSTAMSLHPQNGSPLLIHPKHAAHFLSLPEGDGERQAIAMPAALNDARIAENGLYWIMRDVAFVAAIGPLRSRGYFGYEMLRHRVAAAAGDPNVSAIALILDTPGGSVSGIDQMQATLREARNQKPLIAFVEGMAASAGYWIASQADQIVMTPLSEVGSIGVVYAHFDISKMAEKVGITPTLIFSGAHKVDGNMLQPLPEAVRASIQSDLDGLRAQFAAAVAEGRPGLSVEVAMATEAKMYSANEAIRLGLADKVGSVGDVFAIVSETASRHRASVQQEKPEMTTTNQNDPKPDANATADAVSAAMSRVQSILNCPAAKGRETLASKIAFETALSAEQAVALLEASPKVDDAKAASAGVPPIKDRAMNLPAAEVEHEDAPRDASALWAKTVQKTNSRYPGAVTN